MFKVIAVLVMLSPVSPYEGSAEGSYLEVGRNVTGRTLCADMKKDFQSREGKGLVEGVHYFYTCHEVWE